jgi:hypothetical protein
VGLICYDIWELLAHVVEISIHFLFYFFSLHKDFIAEMKLFFSKSPQIKNENVANRQALISHTNVSEDFGKRLRQKLFFSIIAENWKVRNVKRILWHMMMILIHISGPEIRKILRI